MPGIGEPSGLAVVTPIVRRREVPAPVRGQDPSVSELVTIDHRCLDLPSEMDCPQELAEGRTRRQAIELKGVGWLKSDEAAMKGRLRGVLTHID